MDDIKVTIDELYKKSLIRDYRGESQNRLGTNEYEITYSGKDSSISSIVYDKHKACEQIMDHLLNGLQYNLILYDKSIIQAEFKILGEQIVKERLVFMKKHNRKWGIDEIDTYESLDQDWFSDEEGIPIVIRIDYAPEDKKIGDHSATHMTLSNHQCCRIPMRGIVSFSEFMRFILLHFYDIELELKDNIIDSTTIEEIERKMMHINWE